MLTIQSFITSYTLTSTTSRITTKITNKITHSKVSRQALKFRNTFTNTFTTNATTKDLQGGEEKDRVERKNKLKTDRFKKTYRLKTIGEMKTELANWSVWTCCSDEEVTHEESVFMICDVHFGDTRNDSTPAMAQWLPNDHPEEQYTTNKYSWIQNSRQTTTNLTLAFPCFSPPTTIMQVRC
jgi:hypothetical protein